jgi:hypothetical protein
VALPPGRANLATKPAPTGSMTFTNTIGTVRVVCSNAAVLWPHEGLARGLCHLKGSLLLAKLVRRDPMDPVDRFMLRTLALVLFATDMFLICWGVSAGAGCSHGPSLASSSSLADYLAACRALAPPIVTQTR